MPAPVTQHRYRNSPIKPTHLLRLSDEVVRSVDELEQAFGQPWAVLDTASGRMLAGPADALPIDYYSRLGLCAQIVVRGAAEPIEDAAPLLVIGVPLPAAGGLDQLLAVTAVLVEPVERRADVAPAAAVLGIDADAALRWAGRRTVWPASAALATARAIAGSQRDRLKLRAVRTQLSEVSSSLLAAFEELTLLHRLTDRLSITDNDNELAELAVEWLAEVVPAESMMVYWRSAPDTLAGGGQSGAAPHLVHRGRALFEPEHVPSLLESLGDEGARRCLIFNRELTAQQEWSHPQVRELISVPICPNGKAAGWLLAVNRRSNAGGTRDFGAVEASLMSSVAAILSVHAGNLGLYRQQKSFFAQVVRALSSAIDAKDPYTCGHSDRVARISVRLGRQLGLSAEQLNTLYLSGLLHDIGKIGIDDTVLRKAGQLTPEEYEHIKQHPELGHKILQGVEQLDTVLPVVLHHHEAWNGAGYPAGLKGDACPQLARIVAVADSVDAMGSDRPYRKGMHEDKLEAILRNGAGEQWDAEVVSAYLAAIDDIRQIAKTDRDPHSLDVGTWGPETLSPLAAS
ncbi:Cyclic di-GMP phosphodiesterase response regulator RpfG [Pirellulimonas nuda]|uniref:Cyclic di-GMP phosphodiesterase response regulator RpfG n=1 Tax=Pirellulimonas nuda TaxID=2528009 RepID=A0A518DIS3_9BACT|nr:HD-GYP domain-containing protein [Pirellulimonas nuda]QDU91377.1 Cyclic di-GMP phosphodiesterase response regulator RpfG [Pirellulimonas nuda]